MTARRAPPGGAAGAHAERTRLAGLIGKETGEEGSAGTHRPAPAT